MAVSVGSKNKPKRPKVYETEKSFYLRQKIKGGRRADKRILRERKQKKSKNKEKDKNKQKQHKVPELGKKKIKK